MLLKVLVQHLGNAIGSVVKALMNDTDSLKMTGPKMNSTELWNAVTAQSWENGTQNSLLIRTEY